MHERDSLHARLARMEGLEDEVRDLKERANRADQLAKELDALRGELGQGRRASQDMQNERDSLRKQVSGLAAAEQELEKLRYRAKEAEVLRIERDRLKERLDELAGLEEEYLDLLEKLKALEGIEAERDMYKDKCEELLELEYEAEVLRAQVDRARDILAERDALQRQLREYECCIADQEDEIKRLVSHIDRMTDGRDEQQVIFIVFYNAQVWQYSLIKLGFISKR